MDTHTAVAYQVLCDYRKNTGDASHTVVVSTASPFKFCDHVLQAIGKASDAPGVQLLNNLSDAVNLPVPAPLSGLSDREVRFKNCVEKDRMAEEVLRFLD